MRVNFTIAAIATGLLCLPHSAQADWQFTKWGMSREEVTAAATSQGRALQPINERCLIFSQPYVASGITFERVALCFDDNKLVRVGLQTKSASWADVNEKIATIYGQPTLSLAQTNVYNDQAHGNMLKIEGRGSLDGPVIAYTPLPTGF